MKAITSKVDLHQLLRAEARLEIKIDYHYERKKGEEFKWQPHANRFILKYIENMN